MCKAPFSRYTIILKTCSYHRLSTTVEWIKLVRRRQPHQIWLVPQKKKEKIDSHEFYSDSIFPFRGRVISLQDHRYRVSIKTGRSFFYKRVATYIPVASREKEEERSRRRERDASSLAARSFRADLRIQPHLARNIKSRLAPLNLCGRP